MLSTQTNLFAKIILGIDPGFGPAFAFFTYGSVHRVGMNQFGAYGRAKAGQSYDTILNAYYNNVRLECRNFPNNTISFT